MFPRNKYFKLGFGQRLTPVIKWLLIVNVGMFIITALDRSGYIFHQLALSTQDVLHVPAVWQVFTYQFLHGGFLHLFFNMFFLWMFGSEVEAAFGSKRFLRFYLLCGTGAGIITVAAFFSVPMIIVGASGALLGVLVAFGMMFPNRIIYLYFLFPIKTKYLILIVIGLDMLGAIGGGGNVAHLTHLGGALIGFLYMKSDWRLTSFKSKFTGFRRNMQNKRTRRERQTEDRLMEEVDQILDKISRVGYENLSEKEKKTLERASDALSRRKE